VRPALEPQFDSPEQQRRASSIGMWAFLANEILFFGVLFTAYACAALVHPDAFARGPRLLDWTAGAANTAVLLTSSLCMALAVRAAHAGARLPAVGWLGATFLLGALFLVIKGAEYAHKAHEGRLPETLRGLRGLGLVLQDPLSLFLSLYFIMTGLHALHMLVGLGLLAWMAAKTLRARAAADVAGPVEMTGLYWHFVDVVWIFLFPLLYLGGRG
jgi:cytochrome c oxidase subunit 3